MRVHYPGMAPGDPFDDAALYDWEYRRRRDDVRFYRTLADERGGPILDLGCGTGRLLLPLLRAGHTVVGLDRAAPMLARAAERLRRAAPAIRRRALLLRGDLRHLPVARRFLLAIAAFHTIQHLASDRELARFFAGVARTLEPGGWFVFDTFAPNARFLGRARPTRAAGKRAGGADGRLWARTRFRHPTTGSRTQYWESYRLEGRLLTTTFHYQAVGSSQRSRAADRRVELAHRLLEPGEITRLLAGTGLTVIASWGGFDGRPLAGPTEQHVYLLRRGTTHQDRGRVRRRQPKAKRRS
jgi:SAM-dependent methyltransferase